MEDLTVSPDERRAISALKRLAKRWPPSLWLFSASGTLCVMRANEDGGHEHGPDGGVDQGRLLDKIDIPNDGGDW